MALTAFANGGYQPLFKLPQAVNNLSSTLNATGNNIYVIGPVALSSGPGTSKTFSTSSKMYVKAESGGFTFANGGTSVRFGIQDLDANGAPDGTFDVYKDLVGGGGGLSGGSINQISFDQGTKSITHGQIVAVGLHMTTRAGSDSISMVQAYAHAINEISGRDGLPYLYYNGAKSTNQPLSAVLLSDDGTVGWVNNTILSSVDGPSFAYDSSTSPDEYALIYTPSHNMTICGARVLMNDIDVGDDFEIIHYTTPTGTPSAAITHSVTGGHLGTTVAAGNSRVLDFLFSSTADLTAGTEYGLAVRPTTTNSSTLIYWDGGSTYGASLRPSITNLGTNAALGSRTNQSGAFSTTNYRIPCITPLISRIEAGGGGGGAYAFVSA